ncbi:MAG: hypothetical protein LBB85_01520 [Dysgonamonadaceae bacterium]|jgi:hypothetical protein|nr:hypothetical protein [Dysgonamonadaceae bacterium]
MIHYFNPGHETAILNASKHYQPPVKQVKMQRDLAFLPAWYAQPDDFVWIEEDLTDTFLNDIKDLNIRIKTLSINQLENRKNDISTQNIEFWGISPQNLHRFESIKKKHGLQWQIPLWKEEYRYLGSRLSAHGALSELLESIPALDKTLLPQVVSQMAEIEAYTAARDETLLVKSPFSSSGRGLVWLPPGLLARSERQIIGGMLKKQSQVSIEKVLDKEMDFSMHFTIDSEQAVRFAGYSVFQTTEKGAYKNSCIAAQEVVEKQINSFVDKELLLQVKNRLLNILQSVYAPHYTGNIGVDLLVYRTNQAYRLHPCVEINMRKSMGYLAICLQQQYLHPQTQGVFQIDYEASSGALLKKHALLKQQYPAVFHNGRMVSGYLSLCPVTENSNYHAWFISMR